MLRNKIQEQFYQMSAETGKKPTRLIFLFYLFVTNLQVFKLRTAINRILNLWSIRRHHDSDQALTGCPEKL